MFNVPKASGRARTTCVSSLVPSLFYSLDKGSVAVLRKVEAMNVPDSGEPAMGDLLDAMVVGMHMIRSRTLKK